ncbi:hypothetical protein CRG98_021596 [Punica granatum]|uniref:Uncharacterized protein n=1 Tax=Punica granatum TaxID=22663 RepID=A0A2I0JR99_PUNGR|nr:hypothetical protein CRG98_021596 [Punica granatum]
MALHIIDDYGAPGYFTRVGTPVNSQPVNSPPVRVPSRSVRARPAVQPSNSAHVQRSSPAANDPFGPAAHSGQSGSQRPSSARVPVRHNLPPLPNSPRNPLFTELPHSSQTR